MNSAEKGADLVSIDCMVLYAVLNHYQTTNFRLFQTKKVCKQFQILRKWQKVIQTRRKHCGKRRNCSLRAISTFPTVFSKGLFPRGAKRCHCVGIARWHSTKLLSQTTNFGLFQTERVWRRHNQI